MKTTVEDLTKVNNDVNGNPRYVVHFLKLINEKDESEAKRQAQESKNPIAKISLEYEIALNKAKAIGGQKFHNKQFGGGIVFRSIFNPQDLCNKINKINKIQKS